jgi:hypothetical protein
MEDETVSYLGALGREGAWDVAVLELGINVMAWDEEKRRTHIENTLDKIAAKNPDKPIFVISPFYSSCDYGGSAQPAGWRETIRTVIAERAYPNVTYIPGDSILGGMDLISADCVHPSAYGVAQIAERLLSVMKRVLFGEA